VLESAISKRVSEDRKKDTQVVSLREASADDLKRNPLVYVVVPVFNRSETTLRFLKQFETVTYSNHRIVVVDDGSTDGTRSAIELNFPEVTILTGDGNLWWSGGTNRGVKHALQQGADYILTINDDATFEPEFLTRMVETASQDRRFIVGSRLHCEDRPDEIWAIGTEPIFRGGAIYGLNHAGERWSEIRDSLSNPYPVKTMPGNGVLIPRAVFEQAGFYDEEHMPQYHADSDLVLRAAKIGFKPVVALDSVLHNHICEEALVDNRIDLIFSRKSDRYWKTLWATLRRHAPWGRRTYLLLRQYTPFFFNGPILGRCKRTMARLMERIPNSTSEGSSRGYNPTCDSGPK